MGQILKQRLKQKKFRSLRQEATLNLILAANHLRKTIDDVCVEFGITSQQYNILRILRGAYPDGYRCAEIRERMLDHAPDITRRLDTLQEMGLVKRRRSSEDRRAVVSSITSRGLTLLDEMDPYLHDLDNKIAERLSLKECRELSMLCEKLYGMESE
ncbi:MAG: MarR family transcriptional regulator [Ignavibacteriae bacterium]|nr:MarR family transcriptional regulator [Ignavibacteriota bacterium]MCB9217683.1 MarR family transcriptional regulator [Ignavibacteria bacterium]